MGRAPPPPFGVEEWMDAYETTARYNLAETCCASLSINGLVALSEDKQTSAIDLVSPDVPLTYGEIRGTTGLRENLSRLYSSKVGTPLPPDNILITPGGIAANHLVFYGLLHEDDHVICHHPTYQQLHSIPESLGCKVDLWTSKEDNKWLPDLDDLKALVKEDTKLIVLNNPQNPTGAVLPKSLLTNLVEFAESKSITIMSDEVYRPLFHSIAPMSNEFPPSIVSMGYSKTIAVGSLSKAYALAGIRVGWVASRSREVIERLAATRHYTTISVSSLDQNIAQFALGPNTVHALLSRNINLARTNLELLERFIIKHDEYCSWVKPLAGTTAFVKFERDGKPIDESVFCHEVQEKTGVMLMPGTRFGQQFRGYVRIGFVNSTDTVKAGLEELRKFMRQAYDDVPVHEE